MTPAHTIALVLLINLSFFFITGGLLHAFFQRLDGKRWRHQPNKPQTRAMMLSKLPLVLLNGVILNTMMGLGVAYGGRYGRAYWGIGSHGVLYFIGSTLAMFLFYHLALYYFHRTMHRPALFRVFHHLHHKYKAPMFLDALYEHPFEAFYGGCVVIAPLFLFPVSYYGFFFFLAVMGMHEIVDHSGIDINLPLLSRSRSHDDHHRRSNVYYGQLLPLLDDAHGTVAPRPLRRT